MITDTELERLERLAEAATPGPWTLRKDVCAVCAKAGASEWYIPQIRVGYHAPFANGDDAAFIAELHPSKALALISSVRELRARAEAAEAENERLRKALAPFVKEFEERREAYIRRYPRHPAVGAANFDEMPDHWPMESCTFTMGTFRAARLALETPNG